MYDAGTGAVSTIDGRETAPASADEVLFVEDGEPIPFDEAVTSGLSLGVPGTPLTWQRALDQWGTWELREALGPAEQLARRGFVVDETFAGQTADNAERFADFPATGELFLPGAGHHPRWASCSATPTWPAPTANSAATGSTFSQVTRADSKVGVEND